MRYHSLGRSDLQVPVVVFGAWAQSGWNWGTSDDAETVRAVQAAIDCGMDAIDTAPVYGFGHSERVIGRAIAGRRDRVLLMTKVGLRWDDTHGPFYFHAIDMNGRALPVHKNLRPGSVKHEIEESLKRLGTDRIDLIQAHWPDPRTRIGETMSALLDLRTEGKVRAIGVSNFTPRMLDETSRVLGDVPLASVQPRYSLVYREAEQDVLPWCRRHEVGAIVYSPLEQGLLTGKVPADRVFVPGDGRQGLATFTPDNRRQVNGLLERVVRPIAERRGASVAQVVIAWTLAQIGVTSAIVGARTAAQVEENAAAARIALAPEELAVIREAFEGLALQLPRRRDVAAPLRRLVHRLRGFNGRSRAK